MPATWHGGSDGEKGEQRHRSASVAKHDPMLRYELFRAAHCRDYDAVEALTMDTSTGRQDRVPINSVDEKGCNVSGKVSSFLLSFFAFVDGNNM